MATSRRVSTVEEVMQVDLQEGLGLPSLPTSLIVHVLCLPRLAVMLA